MIKRVGSLLLMMILLFPILGQLEVQASDFIIMPNKDEVVVYNELTGKLSEMGKMRKGEPMFALDHPNPEYWRVKFGNAYGLVKRKDVTVTNNVKVPAPNKQNNSNTVILIERDVDVYDNSRGGLRKFAILKGSYRYPVLEDFGAWWKIDVGGRIGFVAKNATKIDQGVPVLMYHHILKAQEKADSPYANSNTTMTDKEFNEQMDFLKQYGYTTISTKELEMYLNRYINLPAKTVVLTLDDGNISSRIYAYPKLKEHGFKADQFIITSRTPKTPAIFNHKSLHFLSQQEMDQMADVYNYYGHTHALHNLTNKNQSHLVTKSNAEINQDLQLNRKNLKNMTYLAYPFGQYNSTTIQLLKNNGFTLAYTTKNGKAKLGVDKFAIPRIGIEPNVTLKEFAGKVATGSSILDQPEKPAPIPTPPPKPTPNPDEPFIDVKKSEYFYEGVMSLAKRGIIQGYPDGEFKPHNSVTRGQAAKILANALNLNMENVENPNFIDIDEDNEYYKPIAALVREGIISGYPDGMFKPNQTLTRAHMSKMIALGYGLEEMETIHHPFIDVNSDSEYIGYIQALFESNITTGTTSTTFSPNDRVRRGQLAAFVIRAEAK